MARRGMSEKPCHGCGEAKWHRTTGVCRDCETLLAEAKARREAVAAAVDRESAFVPQADWEFPGFYVGGRFSGDRMRDALVQVARRAGERVEQKPGWDRGGPRLTRRKTQDRYPTDDQYLFPGGFVGAFQDLDEEIHKAVTEAFREGLRMGSDLLLQLAAGTLTRPEFEQRTLRVGAGAR